MYKQKPIMMNMENCDFCGHKCMCGVLAEEIVRRIGIYEKASVLSLNQRFCFGFSADFTFETIN